MVEDWLVRWKASKAPGALGVHAKEHAGAIAARLVDENREVREAAVRALLCRCPPGHQQATAETVSLCSTVGSASVS